MTGGLRKRARSYLNVPSTTVTDGRLSFKARGILAYLLDKPAGWDVRSVAIAADSQADGKAAVQAGLRELARAGYYRIEHRRLLDGRLVTGTAVSEEPVTSWASEYAEYEGPVPVVQQPGGGFRVRHRDGSLTGDGFSAGPMAAYPQVTPEPSFPAPVQPVPARPAPVQPVPENWAPLPIQKNHYGKPPPDPPPGRCGSLPWLTFSRGRGMKIRTWQPGSTSWSPRSVRSGLNGRPARYDVPWLSPVSPSAAGSGRGVGCSLSPPIPTRSSPADSPTAARGGTSRASPGQATPDRRGAASAAMSVSVRSTCRTAQ